MKTDQLISNYWTKQGLASKEQNAKNKIIKSTGKYTHYRHPGPNDIKVSKPEIDKLTKEQYRLLYNAEKANRLKRLTKMPFSDLHNKLIANLYSKPNVLKQQALIAKHEEDIKRVAEHLKQVKLRWKKEYNEKAHNYIEICQKDSKGNDSVFMTVYSNKSVQKLKNLATHMVNSITTETGVKTTADVYSKSTYPLNIHIEPITVAA